jgi:hypothetical protein
VIDKEVFQAMQTNWASIASIKKPFLKKEELDEYLESHIEPRISAMKGSLSTIAAQNQVKDEGFEAQIKALDHLERNNELKYTCDIKSDLQSYEILKNEKYGRLA